MSSTDTAVEPLVKARVPDFVGKEPEVTVGARRTRHLLIALAPAAVYLIVRHIGLLILVLLAGPNGTTARDALKLWDGQWYLGIAAGGYSGTPMSLLDAYGDHRPETPLAFFPGYPTLVGNLSDVTGLSIEAAAFLVTIAFGVLAAYALVRIGTLVRGGSRLTGLILVALFAASPMGVVLSMTYSEAMFCALAAWTLVFVLRKQWLPAGLVCAAAGLVRPTALALVLAVCLAALVCAVHVRRHGPRAMATPLLALLIAPIGLLGYLWWAGAKIRPGEGLFAQLGGWSELQERGWDSKFDGGEAALRFTGQAITHSASVHDLVTVAVLGAAVVLLFIAAAQRIEWPLLVYAFGVLAMDLGSNGLMNSKARLLLPAFVLLLPIALGLAKRKPGTTMLILGVIALVSGWFGAHALVIWKYAI